MDDINEQHSQDSYFEDLEYIESQKHDILNGDIVLSNSILIKKLLNKIRSSLSIISKKDMKLLGEKFHTLKSFEERIRFFINNKLDLTYKGYYFTKKSENRTYKISFTIEPLTDTENNIFFDYLIKWFNENLIDKDIKYFTFETLRTNLLESGQIRKKQINSELNKTKERINSLISRERFFTQKYVDGFRLNQSYLLTDFYKGYLTTEKIIIISYWLSPVIGYLEYEKFLNQKLKNEDFITEDRSEKGEKNNGNPVLKGYTFKKIKFFTTENLEKLRIKLIKDNIIEEISFNDFKDIFSEQQTTKVKSTIIWTLENKQSTMTYKRYDWQSLFSFINEVVEPDFTKYNKEIKDLIKLYFDFPDNTLSNKIDDSFADYLETFEKNNRKSTRKINKIFIDLTK